MRKNIIQKASLIRRFDIEKNKKRVYTRDENGVLHKTEGVDQKND